MKLWHHCSLHCSFWAPLHIQRQFLIHIGCSFCMFCPLLLVSGVQCFVPERQLFSYCTRAISWNHCIMLWSHFCCESDINRGSKMGNTTCTRTCHMKMFPCRFLTHVFDVFEHVKRSYWFVTDIWKYIALCCWPKHSVIVFQAHCLFQQHLSSNMVHIPLGGGEEGRYLGYYFAFVL